MFRCVPKLLVLIAAVQILGGHWAVLQTVAWTSMLIDNAKTASFTEALSKTFDGTRPCSLCKAVTAGRSTEEKQEVAKVLVKIEAVLAAVVQLPPPAETSHHFHCAVPVESARIFTPPTPPPRFA